MANYVERDVRWMDARRMTIRPIKQGCFKFGLFYATGELGGRFCSLSAAESAQKQLIEKGYVEEV